MNDKKTNNQHTSYDILGWFLLSFGLLLFIYWAYRTQGPPAGTRQTLTWTIFGAIVLYLFVGIFMFSHRNLSL